MRLQFALATVLLLLLQLRTEAAVWLPPENPDPSDILNEARADARQGRYAIALAKHVWYHENALKIQPSQYGVRLSFALSNWMDLASKYPPALSALRKIRDETETKLLHEDDKSKLFHLFHDYQSINEKLEEQDRSLKLFHRIETKDEKLAKRVYPLVEPDLIKAKKFKLCLKYLEPKKDIEQIAQSYQQFVEFSKQNESAKSHLEFVEQSLTKDASILIALLVVNEKTEEANEIAKLAKKIRDDESYHLALDKALKGVFPD